MGIDNFLKTYIQPWIPLGAVLLAYVLGWSAYFRQKEYELITRRYLDEGLDAISKSVDKSLAIFRHNWGQSLVVLKHFCELGKDMRKELYLTPYMPPDPAALELWRDFRLLDILGDDIFYRAHQSLDVFVRTSYAFFQDDLGAFVRLTLEGGKELEAKTSREEAIMTYVEHVEKYDEQAKKYYILLGELQKLSSILQTERFSFRELKNLKKRQKVVQIIKDLEEELRGDLSTGKKK
jgi:hypothetical protein